MSSIERIFAEIQALTPQEREQLFEKMADFEALRLRKAIQVQKEHLSSQAEAQGHSTGTVPEA